MAMRPSTVNHHSENWVTTNPFHSLRTAATSPEMEAPFSMDTLQSPGSCGFSGFGNPLVGSSMNQSTDNIFSRAKEEPRDEMFVQSLLC
uniref:Uncharacterized protein n=1 Tax=Rhizophora mucronata TaxID=61149 RepID=A0A2P2NP75_RHIMU